MSSLSVILLAILAQPGPAVLTDFKGDWSHMARITPQGYVCHRTAEPLSIDGRADEPAWKKAPWTAYFRDIEGDRKPEPLHKTRARLLWDDRYLYIYAELEEPHVWGTITRKNAVMFHDNDFEVFIDPDGDNHNYYEFEMNALNSIWELSLAKPYKDSGKVNDPHNLVGTKSAVHVRGTLNNPADKDEGWSVEIAFPLSELKQFAGNSPCPPRDGDYWRLGFSRVEWQTKINNGKYEKVANTKEFNWVWSPQGLIDMHRPERWGVIQFTTKPPGEPVKFVMDPTLPARDLLMGVYHRQRAYFQNYGRWADNLTALGMTDMKHESIAEPVTIKLSGNDYLATAKVRMPGGKVRTLHTRADSKLWVGE
ncbi:MAG: carbohydrate-binding family 9-like protein [Planctomycetes bacterium]|nr:carbohydrate-binding family 9-like protein [Planctomycetota bacterium]